MTRPSSPFAPIPVLFLEATDSDLLQFLREAHELVLGCPGLADAVERDLDTHSLKKKALRVADAVWLADRTAPLPGWARDDISVDPASLVLGHGRTRTPSYVVLMAVLLRGYFGAGFKACETATMLRTCHKWESC